MGRRPRVEYIGAIYHVIQRGNNKEFIFERQEDKAFLLGEVVCRQTGLGYRLIGYVILDNHYHLLLQTNCVQLKAIMHRINNKYAKYCNDRYGRTGHVFEQRYKAILVQDEQYLLTLLRYIHQNPVRAGICAKAEQYEWSSDKEYRKGDSVTVETAFVLGSISRNRDTAVRQYCEFMTQMDAIDYKKELYKKPNNPDSGMVLELQTNTRKELDDILLETGVNEQDFNLIKAGSRKRNLTHYKMEYARKAFELQFTLKEIGWNINLTDKGAARLIK